MFVPRWRRTAVALFTAAACGLLIRVFSPVPASLEAQDFTFGACNRNVPGISNRGVTAVQAAGYLNTMRATLIAKNPPGPPVKPGQIVVADANGDGCDDIFFGDQSTADTGHLQAYLGTGTGAFAPWQDYTFTGQLQSMVTTDVDLDGLPDVAIGLSGPRNQIEVFTSAFMTGIAAGPLFTPTPIVPRKLGGITQETQNALGWAAIVGRLSPLRTPVLAAAGVDPMGRSFLLSFVAEDVERFTINPATAIPTPQPVALEFNPTTLTIGPIGTYATSQTPRLGTLVGAPAGIDLYLFDGQTGAVHLRGSENPQKIAIKIDDLGDGRRTASTISLGSGVITVAGSDPNNVNLQAFVVNAHSGAFDLSVFGFEPERVAAVETGGGGAMLPRTTIAVAEASTAEHPRGAVSTFTLPHVLETAGRIQGDNTFDTTIFATYQPGIAAPSNAAFGRFNGPSGVPSIVGSGPTGLGIGTLDSTGVRTFVFDAPAASAEMAGQYVDRQSLARLANSTLGPLAATVMSDAEWMRGFGISSAEAARIISGADTGRAALPTRGSTWDWGALQIGTPYQSQITLNNTCSWPQTFQLTTSHLVGLETMVPPTVTVPGGSMTRVPVTIRPVQSAGNTWIDVLHRPSAMGDRYCPAGRQKFDITTTTTGVAGASTVISGIAFAVIERPKPVLPAPQAIAPENASLIANIRALVASERQREQAAGIDPAALVPLSFSTAGGAGAPSASATAAATPMPIRFDLRSLFPNALAASPANGNGITSLTLQDIFDPAGTRAFPTSGTPFTDAITGLTDLAVTDIGSPTNTSGVGQVIVMLNDGTGTFTDFGAFRQFVATPGATNVLAGDFNQDGNDDLVYIDPLTNVAFIALNDGANFFRRTRFRETGAFLPVSARLGDVNDDDRLDLVVAHQGAPGGAGNQSVVTTLFGDGTGRLVPTNSFLQVPNFALSLIGGTANFETNNIPRIVDFNQDGFPDFAVASSRGGNSVGQSPTLTLLFNRPDSPGTFNVQPPIPLIDGTMSGPLQLADFNQDGKLDAFIPAEPQGSFVVRLGQADGTFGPEQKFQIPVEDTLSGPAIVSGRQGDTVTSARPLGVGGANFSVAVADFDVDGSPDLIEVSGEPSFVPLRSTLFAFGNEAANMMSVARPLRNTTTIGSNILSFAPAIVPGASPPPPLVVATGSGTAAGAVPAPPPFVAVNLLNAFPSDVLRGVNGAESSVQLLIIWIEEPIQTSDARPISDPPFLPLSSSSLMTALGRMLHGPSSSTTFNTAVRTGTSRRGAPFASFAQATQAAGAPPVQIVVKSLGTSQGEAFEMQIVNDGPRPARVSADGLVVEPIRRSNQRDAQRAVQGLGARLARATTAKVEGYCLEYALNPPDVGMLFRIASPEIQAKYAPARSVLRAASRLAAAGSLHPDSNAKSYLESIKQYAVWSKVENWDVKKFTEIWIDKTKKNAAAARQPWTKALEDALTAAAPGRWRDIQAIFSESQASTGR